MEKWVACGRTGAHPTGDPLARPAEKVIRADGTSSVAEDVFVVGHGIHTVARLAGPRPIHGASGGKRAATHGETGGESGMVEGANSLLRAAADVVGGNCAAVGIAGRLPAAAHPPTPTG